MVEGGVVSLRVNKNHSNYAKYEHEPTLSAEAQAAISKANQAREHSPNRQRIPKDKLKMYDFHRNEEHKANKNMDLSDHALRKTRESFTGSKKQQYENKIYSARKQLHEKVFFHGNAADAIYKQATGQKPVKAKQGIQVNGAHAR